MKTTALFTFLFLAVGMAEASSQHHRLGISRISNAHHGRNVARHDTSSELTRRADAPKKRCKPKPKATSSSAPPAPTTTTAAPAPAETPNEAIVKPNTAKTETKNTDPPKDTPKQENNSSPAPSVGGLLTIGSACGASGATDKVTATSGPNGNIDFFNCGVEGSGWNPPHVTVQDLKVKDLGEVLNDPNSPFKPCAPFIDMFYKYAAENGIPPILIAATAMQESTCNPHSVGGGGEQGLMQITKEKCGGAPGGNCQDPDFNIRVGAGFLANTIKNAGGNVIQAVAQYNGWFPGMNIGQATAARNSACCLCQNNLDYLQQYFNGWCQGISPYQNHIGKYFNLDVCPGRS
ncbi:hypothetical protein QCA50_009680 [Cerrena zonata]|uniref:Transglycosylase SLT domain-containing protein n=1 Tax=Cerrena zonata TaxID=2478898 RepID=A0AAW0G2C6_9APHY